MEINGPYKSNSVNSPEWGGGGRGRGAKEEEQKIDVYFGSTNNLNRVVLLVG